MTPELVTAIIACLGAATSALGALKIYLSNKSENKSATTHRKADYDKFSERFTLLEERQNSYASHCNERFLAGERRFEAQEKKMDDIFAELKNVSKGVSYIQGILDGKGDGK